MKAMQSAYVGRKPCGVDFGELQRRHGEWCDKNFGADMGGDPDRPAWSFLGVVEEAGELAHALLKQRQGIRGDHGKHEAAAKDAVGDILLFLCDFCNRFGLDLGGLVGRSVLGVQYEPLSCYLCVVQHVGVLADLLLGERENRGDEPRGRRRAGGAVMCLVSSVVGLCDSKGWDLQEIIATTTAEVWARDWTANKGEGVAS